MSEKKMLTPGAGNGKSSKRRSSGGQDKGKLTVAKMPSFHSVATFETVDTNNPAKVQSPLENKPEAQDDTFQHSSGSERSDNAAYKQEQWADEEEDIAGRAWPLFAKASTGGTVGIKEVIAIADDLGIDLEEDHLTEIVPPAKRFAIYFEDCCDYIKEAIQSSRDNIFKATSTTDTEDLKVHRVSPWQALMYSLGCDDVGTVDGVPIQYEVDINLCCNAKVLLILSSLLVFLVVAGAIITFPSIIWLKTAIERSEEMISDFETIVSQYGRLLEKRILDAHLDSIKDTTATFARISEYLWRRSIVSSFQYLENELRVVDALLVGGAVAEGKMLPSIVAEKLDALSKFSTSAADSTVTPDLVKMIVQAWIPNEGMYLHMNSTAQGFTKQSVLVSFPVDASVSQEATCDFSSFAGRTTPYTATHVANLTDGSSLTVVQGYIPTAQVLVCFASNPTYLTNVVTDHAQVIVEEMNDADCQPEVGLRACPEVSLWSIPPANVPSARPELLTDPREDRRRCRLPNVNCSEFSEWLNSIARQTNYDEPSAIFHHEACPNTTERIFLKELHYYNGETAIVAAKLNLDTHSIIVTALIKQFLTADYKERLVAVVEHLNWAFSRTTEIVISYRDDVGRIIPQASSFRFAELCYGQCERFAEAAETAFLSYRSEEAGGFIGPDYRPEPVVSLYTSIEEGLDMGLIIERDVQELRRRITQKGIVLVADSINSAASVNREILLLHWDHYKYSRLFNPDYPCDDNVHCLTRDDAPPGTGILFRGDCRHCARRDPSDENSTFSYLTKLTGKCRPDPNRPGKCSNDDNLAKRALAMDPGRGGDHEMVERELIYTSDYAGVPVLALLSFYDTTSTAAILTMDEASLRNPILLGVAVSAILASGLTAICLMLVALATHRVLAGIEEEWREYKSQIEIEKEKFSHFVKFMIPRHLLPMQQAGTPIIAEPSPNATIVVVDIVGLSTALHQHNARSFVRYLTYYVNMLDVLAARYGIFKLKMYGDVFVGVTSLGKGAVDQLERDTSKPLFHGFDGSSNQLHHMLQNPAAAPPVLNVAAFSALLLQLVSHEFVHPNWQGLPAVPHRSATQINTDGLESTQEDIVTLRIGINTGPLVGGYVDSGRMPKFDCHGQSMALAHRMQLTCPNSRIHVTTYYKDELENIDNKLLFDYEAPRKTIVKGRGTVVSYVLRSAFVPVPEQLLAKLRMQHAPLPFFFSTAGADEKYAQNGSRSRSDGGSRSRASSSRASSRSGGSSRRGPRSVASSSSSGTKQPDKHSDRTGSMISN